MIRYAVTAMAAISLLGCATNPADTAWQLMERQQQEQALLRQYESEQNRQDMPSAGELMLAMIHDAQRDGRYFASLAYIDSYILETGPTPDVLLLKADALRVTGDYANGESVYRQLLTTPVRASARHGLGLLAGQQGDYTQAVRELSEAARLQPANATVLNDLGYAMLRAGDIRGARLPLGQAAELEPDNGTIISNLVLFLLLNGEHARADQVRTQAGLSDALFSSILALARQVRTDTPTSVTRTNPPAATSPTATTVTNVTGSARDWIGHEPLLQ